MTHTQDVETSNNPVMEQAAMPPAKRYTLSKDPNKAMQEMMTTIDRLRATLIEETNAVKKADTKTFMAMQDNKIAVSSEYLDGMTQLLSRTNELKDADPSLKDRLEAMRLDFSEIAQENHAALNRMKNGMQRLGERIMEKARTAAKEHDQIIYGSSGHMQTSLKSSMGINESV